MSTRKYFFVIKLGSTGISNIFMWDISIPDNMLLKTTNAFVSSNLSLFVYVNYGREENVTQDH